MMYRGYWIEQAPEDGSYNIYYNHFFIEGGFETKDDACEYLDYMES